MNPLAAVLITPLVLAAESGPSGTRAEPLSLRFGVTPSDKATSLYGCLSPLLDALRASLEERLGRPVEIELTIFRGYEEGIDALARGEVDFGRCGPAAYVAVKEREPGVGLIAMEMENGEKRLRGVIVARKADGIDSLQGLRGKTIAFGDPNSGVGRYMAQAKLVEAGITGGALADFQYLGRHDRVAAAVELGDFDAGALSLGTFEKSNWNGTLRVLATFECATRPWVARRDLDADLVSDVRRCLLDIHDEEALGRLGLSGFAIASDDDYRAVRDGMRLAEAFERPSRGN